MALAALFGARAQADDLVSAEANHDAPFDLPVYVDGRYIGDVAAWSSGAGVRLDAERLREAIAPVATSDVLNRLERLRLEGQPLTPERLQGAGIDAIYDSTDIAIRISLTAEQRRLQIYSVGGRFESSSGERLAPAKIAAGLEVSAERRWSDEGGDGTIVDLDGFAILGGPRAPVLIVNGSYDDSRATAWRRRQIALVRDDETHAIRAIVGDQQPRLVGFQTAPQMVGIGLARDYGDIQPDRNVRPASRSIVSVERNSDVEVIVNGVVVDRLRLGAGRYDLRDLPFTDGLSEVKVAVEDPAGRRETIVYSGFTGPELLGQGVTDFSVVAGALRSIDQSGEARGPALTGFVRTGLRDTLTVGADVQLGEDVGVIGGSLAAATKFGVASLEAAASLRDGDEATAVGIGLRAARDNGRTSDLLLLRAEAIDTGFRTIETAFTPPTRARALASVQRSWRGGPSVSAGVGYELSRSGDETWRASVGVSRTYARFSTSVRAEYVDADRHDPDVRLSAAIAFRFGERQMARLSRDGATGTVDAEWRRLERTGVGDWAASLRARETDGLRSLGGEALYLGNRFRLAAAHDADFIDARATYRGAEIEYANARVRRASRISLGTAIGWTPGRVAFGREIGDAFVLLAPDPSLKGRRVRVEQGGRAAAIVDRRPVLAPLSQPYRRLDLTLDGSTLPDGYDLGDPRLTVRPAFRSAYVRTVGSPAITIEARLLDRDHAPLALTVGLLRPLSPDGGAPIPFFTNRSGRMIAERVRPGRYAVHVNGRAEAIGELTAPAGTDGAANLGNVILGARLEHLR